MSFNVVTPSVQANQLVLSTEHCTELIVRATDSQGQFVDQTFIVNVLDSEEVTLTTGTDTIAPSVAYTQVIGNALTLNAADDLDGGDGFDSLVLFGGGTFDLNSLAGFANFEEVRVVNITNTGTDLTLRDGTTSDVVISGTSRTSTVIDGTAIVGSFQGGGGNDRLYVYSASAWNPNITIDGGAGFDELWLINLGETYDLQSATLTGVERLWFSSVNITALIDTDALTNFTLIGGAGGSRIVTSEATLDLTGKTVDEITVESSNGTGTTFKVDNKATAFQIIGGPGADTIETSSFAFTALERELGAPVSRPRSDQRRCQWLHDHRSGIPLRRPSEVHCSGCDDSPGL